MQIQNQSSRFVRFDALVNKLRDIGLTLNYIKSYS